MDKELTEEEFEKKELEAKEKQEELKAAWEKVQDSESAMLIINAIIEYSALDEPSFLPAYVNSPNMPSLISYREGQRSIGLFIKESLEGI